jgi:hypothetical protein
VSSPFCGRAKHSRAHGWVLNDLAPRCVSLETGARPRPEDLFFCIHGNVIWKNLAPKLDLSATLPHDHADAAGWYLGYASMDVTECIEWQLAEDSDSLEGNPFLPLMRCYAAGFYPFSLGPSEMAMFTFNG